MDLPYVAKALAKDSPAGLAESLKRYQISENDAISCPCPEMITVL
jgi:hypothetical protein